MRRPFGRHANRHKWRRKRHANRHGCHWDADASHWRHANRHSNRHGNGDADHRGAECAVAGANGLAQHRHGARRQAHARRRPHREQVVPARAALDAFQGGQIGSPDGSVLVQVPAGQVVAASIGVAPVALPKRCRCRWVGCV